MYDQIIRQRKHSNIVELSSVCLGRVWLEGGAYHFSPQRIVIGFGVVQQSQMFLLIHLKAPAIRTDYIQSHRGEYCQAYCPAAAVRLESWFVRQN